MMFEGTARKCRPVQENSIAFSVPGSSTPVKLVRPINID